MKKSRFINKIYPIAFAAATVVFAGCGSIFDDLEPCDEGVRLKFVYDYNMEFADAFAQQADCLTVVFYDTDGRYVASSTAASDDVKNPSYRMDVDLSPGTYNLFAYGGLVCDEASYNFSTRASEVSMPMHKVSLRENLNTHGTIAAHLHPHFYGARQITVEEGSMQIREYTVEMMKNTNSVRVLLQQAGGEQLNSDDFDFSIDADNLSYNHQNRPQSESPAKYEPWTRGNANLGENSTGVSVAFAEMSLGRLMSDSRARLRVTRRADGHTVVDIPLVDYLLLLKSDLYSQMPAQEYLDRENRWSMIFLLDTNGSWVADQIVINDWIIKLHNVDI